MRWSGLLRACSALAPRTRNSVFLFPAFQFSSSDDPRGKLFLLPVLCHFIATHVVWTPASEGGRYIPQLPSLRVSRGCRCNSAHPRFLRDPHPCGIVYKAWLKRAITSGCPRSPWVLRRF